MSGIVESRRPGPAPTISDAEDEVSLRWFASVVVANRRALIAITAVGIVLGATVALLRKPTYTSTFSFLAETTQDPGRAGLASLAGQFGISLGSMGGSSQPPQLYADLLVSREVLTPIAADSVSVGRGQGGRVPLHDFLKVSGSDSAVVLDNAIRRLKRDVVAAAVATRTGMVTVTVRTRSPQVSKEVADRLLTGLNRFNLITKQTQAGAERQFAAGRLEAAREALRAAEDALQRFLQANRQFSNSPELTFQRDRLQREVTLQQQIVTSLAQQYEEARIREVRDTPLLTVIEHPIVPARPDPQFRALTVIMGALSGLVAGLLLVLAVNVHSRRLGFDNDPTVETLSLEWLRTRGKP
jgi:uncharacterized protein involved in exopolysaccharide biosynthesis